MDNSLKELNFNLAVYIDSIDTKATAAQADTVGMKTGFVVLDGSGNAIVPGIATNGFMGISNAYLPGTVKTPYVYFDGGIGWSINTDDPTNSDAQVIYFYTPALS